MTGEIQASFWCEVEDKVFCLHVTTKTAMDKEKRKSREEEKRLRDQRDRLKKTEQEIGRAEEEAAKAEKELADPKTWENPEVAAELTRRYNALKQRIDDLYIQYEELDQELNTTY